MDTLTAARRKLDVQYEIYAYKNKQMGSSFLCFPSFLSPAHTPSFAFPLGHLLNKTWEMPVTSPIDYLQSRAEPEDAAGLAVRAEDHAPCQARQSCLMEPHSQAAYRTAG